MSELHLGWHFCEIQDGKPVLRDGSPLRIGHTYEYEGQLAMCKSGYHSSERLIDALRYAPGAYLCRVVSSCDMADTDKYVSRHRCALAGMDVTMILHQFAARVAYCALMAEREAGREPHKDSWNAIAVKMFWCIGAASHKKLSAARSAAWSAAWSAAESAALSAARSAAESAAWSAAESAARSAAWSAARSAARSAAWSAAWSAALSAAESAAWSAAESTAWSVARSAANDLLESMLPKTLVTAEGGEDG